MGKRRRKRISCPNCGIHLKEEMNYCFNCGQENHIKRVTIKLLLSDFTTTYFSFDNKLFRSLRYLLFKPSFLSLEYLNGKINSYLTPIRLYVFISFFFFVLLGLRSSGNAIDDLIPTTNTHIKTSDQPISSLKQNPQYEEEAPLITNNSADIEQKFQQIFSDRKEVRNFFNYMQNKLPILLFLMIPVLGLVLFLCFYRKEYFYTDHFVFALHLQTFMFVMLSIATLSNWIFSISIKGLAALMVLTYGFIAAKKFYKRSFRSTLLRLILVGFVHVFISILASVGFFFLIIKSYTI